MLSIEAQSWENQAQSLVMGALWLSWCHGAKPAHTCKYMYIFKAVQRNVLAIAHHVDCLSLDKDSLIV